MLSRPDRAVETAATRGAKPACAGWSSAGWSFVPRCQDRAVDGELRSHSSNERREAGLRRLEILEVETDFPSPGGFRRLWTHQYRGSEPSNERDNVNWVSPNDEGSWGKARLFA
jgi:hypothetical protein